jgi:hypothetical protein
MGFLRGCSAGRPDGRHWFSSSTTDLSVVPEAKNGLKQPFLFSRSPLLSLSSSLSSLLSPSHSLDLSRPLSLCPPPFTTLVITVLRTPPSSLSTSTHSHYSLLTTHFSLYSLPSSPPHSSPVMTTLIQLHLH